jgi:5'-nucleotidase
MEGVRSAVTLGVRVRVLLAAALVAFGCSHPRTAEQKAVAAPPARVRLLTINDFHGQLPAGKKLGGRPVGSAGVLGAWLAASWAEHRTVLVSAGDLVGASPPASALFQDEPTVAFVNRFAGPACRTADLPAPPPSGLPLPEADPRLLSWLDPECEVVGTIGNHELDEGREELLRLLAGGNHPRGPFLDKPWRGARWPTVVANVIDRSTGRTLFPAFVVKRIDGVPVGFVGAVTRGVAQLVSPAGVAGLEFLDEADAVNRQVRLLRDRGVRAIVVIVHQGGDQPPYAGPTREGTTVEGEIVDLVARLDPEVDVVVAAHTHAFLNAWLPAAGGKRVLTVEAFSAGTAFGWVDLEVDRSSGDVVAARAAVQTAWADDGPGRTPDRASAALQSEAEARVATQVKRQVATAAAALGRRQTAAGESHLGDLVADAHRAAAPGAQVAFTNAGGLRADLPAGPLTWGDLFAAQPFGNELVALTLTGADLLDLLESQWGPGRQDVLQVSGLSYGWSAAASPGSKVRGVQVGGVPLDPAARYRVVVNGFLAGGGDGFGVLGRGVDRAVVGADLDALIAHLGSLPQPVGIPSEGRIRALP